MNKVPIPFKNKPMLRTLYLLFTYTVPNTLFIVLLVGIIKLNSVNPENFPWENLATIIVSMSCSLIVEFPLFIIFFILPLYALVTKLPKSRIILICVGLFITAIAINSEHLKNLLEEGLWLIFVLINLITTSLNAAADFQLGKFKEDSSYVSGTYYEVTFEGNNAKITEENEYSGGGEWFKNPCLFFLRMLIITFVGTIIGLVKISKELKKASKDNKN